jgi:hypothetical protein
MTHHPAFSTRVGNQEADKATRHSEASPGAIHEKAGGSPAARTKGMLHDSAFLAERGCLGAAKPYGQAHSH